MGSREAQREAVQVKTSVDRALANRGQARIWAALLPALDRVDELRDLIARLGRTPKVDSARLARIRAQLASAELEYRILKETVLDRTLPTLSRVDVQALMAMLPEHRAERDGPGDAQERAKRESFRRLCRGEITVLRGNGSGA